MITLTNKDGVAFEVEAAAITKVEPLNPLSALAYRAKSVITIDSIRQTMVKEDTYSIMNMIIREVMK